MGRSVALTRWTPPSRDAVSIIISCSSFMRVAALKRVVSPIDKFIHRQTDRSAPLFSHNLSMHYINFTVSLSFCWHSLIRFIHFYRLSSSNSSHYTTTATHALLNLHSTYLFCVSYDLLLLSQRLYFHQCVCVFVCAYATTQAIFKKIVALWILSRRTH